MSDVETPLDILGAGAGGPLPPGSPWISYNGYLQYSGGIVLGSPTGGNKGPGTLNLLNLFVNNQNFSPASVVLLTGGTMTGLLFLSGDPTNPLGAVTKQYADTKLPLAGGTMTGAITLNADPTANLQPATKHYVDVAVAGAGTGVFLPIAGGTLTGFLTLNANPTAVLHAAPKQYVDTGDVAKVSKTGDTMTGLLSLSGNPTANLHATPKQYVDGRTPITADAPSDGNYYTRFDGTWAVFPGGITIPDAVSDGNTYARLNGQWTSVYDPGTF